MLIDKTRLAQFTTGLVQKINSKFQEFSTRIDSLGSQISSIGWDTLENVASKEVNYYNKNNLIRGSRYNAQGDMESNSAWSCYRSDFRLKRGVTYTIAKKMQTIDSATVIFLNSSNTTVSVATTTERRVGDYFLIHVTIPEDTNISRFAFNVHLTAVPNLDVLIYEGSDEPVVDITTPYNHCPLEVKEHTIGIGFDNTGTTLVANSIQDAVKELAIKATLSSAYRYGETRTFAYDISNEVNTLNTVSDNIDDASTNTVGNEVGLDGGVWLKCEGQIIQRNGIDIKLPKSTEGNYIFMCIG